MSRIPHDNTGRVLTSKSWTGINVNSDSSNNKIFANTISHSITNALLVARGSSGNTFSSNKIVSSTPQGLKIEQDPTSKNNIFSNNQNNSFFNAVNKTVGMPKFLYR